MSAAPALALVEMVDRWPAALGPAARHGVIGQFLELVEPHTEADPAAIAIQALVAIGNVIGRGPFYRVGSDRHHANLNALVVGASAVGGKGESWGHVRRWVGAADPEWLRCCVGGGLSSGEGLITAVCDAEVVKTEDGEAKIARRGADDKRLCADEGEFANVLAVMRREGNTLSALIRNAWDTGYLRTRTRREPLRATDAHISIIGHITGEELRHRLVAVDASNGFANRFLFVCARRTKLLPDGGALTDRLMADITDHLADRLVRARQVREMTRDEASRALWHTVYAGLSAERAGVYGSVTSRAKAQVLRLSMIYALLDGSEVIRREHLIAALEIWQYCDDSAAFLFADLYESPLAMRITAFLAGRGGEGATTTDLRDLFGRNKRTEDIQAALEEMERAGKVEQLRGEPRGKRGRPPVRWALTEFMSFKSFSSSACGDEGDEH